MTTARELMSEGDECARSSDTLTTAAQRMRELGVGSMPIRGEDDRLAGIITDRDRCSASPTAETRRARKSTS
jgi:CBS domain-containing protein